MSGTSEVRAASNASRTMDRLARRCPFEYGAAEFWPWMAYELERHRDIRRRVNKARELKAAADKTLRDEIAATQAACPHDALEHHGRTTAEADEWDECGTCGLVLNRDAEYRRS